MSPTLGVVGGILGGIILLAGAIKALPTVWEFVKALARVPLTVERMHAEFSPNGGGSLRDAIDRVNADLSSVIEWQATHTEDDNQRLAALTEHDIEMSEYLHRRMHDVLGAITPIIGWAPIHDERLRAIEQQLRISAEADEIVAADLIEAQAAVQGVADDLAAERDGILHPPDVG
jgi:hypothetical protein